MRNLKIIRILTAFILTAVLFSACEKDEDFEPMEDKGQKFVKFVDFGGTGGGFNSSGLAFAAGSDGKLDVQLELIAPKVYSNDLKITVAVDTTLVAAYNATKVAATDKYNVLPTSAYASFTTKTVLIKAGQTMSEVFQIEFKPDMIDGSKNYMIPLVIKSIEGAGDDLKAAPNTGVAYFHFIGNPLAGEYDVTGYFYHPTVPRAFVRPLASAGLTGTLKAYSPVSLITDLGDLGEVAGYAVLLTVPDPSNTTTIQPVTISPLPGGYISPVYQWNDGLPTTNPGYTAGWSRSAECNNTYDPATKTFKLRYGYLGANGYRVTEEILVKK